MVVVLYKRNGNVFLGNGGLQSNLNALYSQGAAAGGKAKVALARFVADFAVIGGGIGIDNLLARNGLGNVAVIDFCLNGFVSVIHCGNGCRAGGNNVPSAAVTLAEFYAVGGIGIVTDCHLQIIIVCAVNACAVVKDRKPTGIITLVHRGKLYVGSNAVITKIGKPRGKISIGNAPFIANAKGKRAVAVFCIIAAGSKAPARGFKCIYTCKIGKVCLVKHVFAGRGCFCNDINILGFAAAGGG